MSKTVKKKDHTENKAISEIYEIIQKRGFLQELWWDVLKDIKQKPTYQKLKSMVKDVIDETVKSYDVEPVDEEEQVRRRTSLIQLSIMTYAVDTVLSEVLYRKFYNEFTTLTENMIQDYLSEKQTGIFKNIEDFFNKENSTLEDPRADESAAQASSIRSSTENKEDIAGNAVVRRRGRPKKSVTETKSKEANTAKRKRGRPQRNSFGNETKEKSKQSLVDRKKSKNDADNNKESDEESEMSVGNLSFDSVSSVHTSELSSFEDTISIGSDEEGGKKKHVPLKLANDMYLSGKLGQIYSIGKKGEQFKLLQNASTNKTNTSHLNDTTSAPRKILPHRIRKPNSKYTSETMYSNVKDNSSAQTDSSSSYDDTPAAPRQKPKKRRKLNSGYEKNDKTVSSPTVKKSIRLTSATKSTLESKRLSTSTLPKSSKNRYDSSDLYKPRPVIGSACSSRSTAF